MSIQAANFKRVTCRKTPKVLWAEQRNESAFSNWTGCAFAFTPSHHQSESSQAEPMQYYAVETPRHTTLFQPIRKGWYIPANHRTVQYPYILLIVTCPRPHHTAFKDSRFHSESAKWSCVLSEASDILTLHLFPDHDFCIKFWILFALFLINSLTAFEGHLVHIIHFPSQEQIMNLFVPF